MNRVILIGNISKDLELKTTQSGKGVVRFTLAVSRDTAEGGTDFIDCVIFGKQAENLYKYQKKGNKIAVTGSLRIESYKNKEGQTRYSTSVVCDRIEFLSRKETSETSNDNFFVETEDVAVDPKNEPEEDLPF